MSCESTGAFTRLGLALVTGGLLAVGANAQVVTPRAINTIDGPTCFGGPNGMGGHEDHEVCITLPPDTTTTLVDIFLLFDDTGSFEDDIPELQSVFADVVSDLQASLPSVDFAFGVGRYEDYGGEGRDFTDADGLLPGLVIPEEIDGRPFILNQALLASDNVTFNAAIGAALNATAPGRGGDFPETAFEGLWQVATGAGFDGNGNGNSNDSGPAGAVGTQTMPGDSGDVPAFNTYVGSGDGTLGGVGWRQDSLRLVLLASDNCPVSAFSGNVIPATVTGVDGTSAPVSDFACFAAAIGDPLQRFGFVSDAKSEAANTVNGAVVPSGGATVQETVDALINEKIRVIGLFASGDQPGNPTEAEVYLTALARLTGAVDKMDNELVFDIGGGGDALADAIVDSVELITIDPIDIKLVPEGVDPCLTVDITREVQMNVAPGDTVCFDVTFTGDACFEGDNFDLVFRDNDTNAELGEVPVRLTCNPPKDECITVDFETDSLGPLVNGQVPVFNGLPFVLSSGGVNEGAAIFDTDVGGPNDPGADDDLLVDLGNALILQENPGQSVPGIFDVPDDNNWGGWHLFELPEPSLIESMDLIDICPGTLPPQDTRVILTDENGLTRKYIVPSGFTSDITDEGTGFETLLMTSNLPQAGHSANTSVVEDPGFDQTHVVAMLVTFKGSAAIDNIRICPPEGGGGGQVMHTGIRRIQTKRSFTLPTTSSN